MTLSQLDILWVLASTCVLFVLQIGFLCIETGLTRSKNSTSTASKFISGFALSAIVYWLFGFAIMYGASYMGYIGTSGFASAFTGRANSTLVAIFIFQLMLCATTLHIVAGAAAERLRFAAYILLACIIAGLIFPVFGHWAWNGQFAGLQSGWMGRLGFVDFAGASVVHSVGGWAALATIMILGPRLGRFDETGQPRALGASNISLASVGLLLLLFGWPGFSAATNYTFNDDIPGFIIRTFLAGAIGLIIGLLCSRWLKRAISFQLMMVGCIAGLVSISGSVHAVSIPAALVIGGAGAIFAIVGIRFLERSQIDDAVHVIPAHLIGGIWGTLAVGIFGDPARLATGLSFQEQIGAQLIGIAICGLWAFGITWIILSLINRFWPLRISAESEQFGLDITEHGASTELRQFTDILNRQAQTGDLSLRAPSVAFSNLAPIVSGYNRVMGRLENNARRSDAIVTNSRDGIIVFDEETLAIDLINPAAEQIFAYSAESVKGHQIVELLDFTTQGNPRIIFNYILETASPYQLNGLNSDGDTLPLEVTLAKSNIASRAVFIASIRDVTERELQQRELEDLNARLVESSQYKDEFMASMSHELRTPLNAILGMSEALSADVYGALSENQQNATETIHASGKHLLAIIDDILDLSKISAGEQSLDLHPISIKSVCTGSIALVTPLAEQKGVEITTTYDPQVHSIIADPTRLKQILVNLLNNAVKFTDSGGKIGVMVVGAPSSEQVHLIVWDTGVGIEDSEISKLFEPFVQGDGSYGRRFGGAGLGLAIVNRLVKLHGGRVRVTSEVGKGSRFIVSLPWQPRGKKSSTDTRAITKALQSDKHTEKVSQMMYGVEETIIATLTRGENDVPLEDENGDDAPDTIAPVEKKADSAESSLSILLAEDNETNVKTLSDYLVAHGFSIKVARDGLEAVQHITECRPDIVLMDIQMPKMDGLSAIRKIRRDWSPEALPIIALTAFAMPGDRERCLDAGANDYLSKPVGLKSLLQRINLQIGQTNGAS